MEKHYKFKLETVISVTDIINISYYKLPKNFVFSGESHDFWEFIYADKGELVITAGDRRYVLKAGELAFHQPGEFHNLQALKNITANVIVVSFVCQSPFMEYFKNKILFLNHFEKQCLFFAVQESESSYESFEKAPPSVCMKKKPEMPFGSDQLLKTSLEQLFIHICRRGESITTKERSIPSNQLQNHTMIFQEIKQYLEEHYSEKITLEILAVHNSISISQLKRIFKEQMGIPVIAYLTKIRIGEAKRMIQERGLNFTQIAEYTGYDNIYYFSRRFKEQTGMTPSEYALSLKQ